MSGFKHIVHENLAIQDKNAQKNYATESLCCLSVTNPFREKIIRIVLSPWFDRFILVVILTNCVFLAIDDPNVPAYEYQQISDIVFMIIFTIEMVLKIIAMGFVMRPFSYLRDMWNILDFIVVIMGWISQFVNTSNVSAIRVIRILRPLRTINSIPSMRKLVTSILNSLPTMLDVFILFVFFLVMFGTVATQLFGGILQGRCQDKFGTLQKDVDDNEVFCSSNSDCDSQNSYYCNESYGNPDQGVSSFDNILLSDLNIFIIITLEGWTQLMYYVRHATGSYLYDIFFVFVVILGSFFILNLLVAVQFSYLSISFQENKAKDLEKQKQLEESKIHQENLLQSQQQQPSTHQLQQQPDTFEQAVNQIEIANENTSYNNIENTGTNLNQAQTNNVGEEFQSSNSLKKKIKCKLNCPFLTRLSKKVRYLIDHRIFNIVIIILIIINTIFMAIQYYNMPDPLQNACNLSNEILTCIFAVEMVLKLFGLGIKEYVMDGFNDFDAIIVIIGILEFANVGNKAILVLRAFRLLRIFKIIRSWVGLRKLLETVLSSLKSIANLGLLMCLLSFIYILIGMQFLSNGQELDEDGNRLYQYQFNSFGESIITIFILLTAENWNSLLYMYIQQNGWVACIYFVSLIVFGNIMLLNLFLAILLNFISDNFDNDVQETHEKQDKEEEEDSFERQLKEIQSRLRAKHLAKQSTKMVNDISIIEKEEDSKKQTGWDRNDMSLPQVKIEDINVHIIGGTKKITEKSQEDSSSSEQNNNNNKMFTVPFSHSPELIHNPSSFFPSNTPIEFAGEVKDNNQNSIQITQQNEDKKSEDISITKKFKLKNRSQTILNLDGKSLFILRKDNKLRVLIKQFLEHPYFENFIFNLIGINSVMLTISQPIVTDPYQIMTIELFTNIISGLFILEAILKIIVLGFVIGKQTYLRDAWNILDFVIVFFSVLNWVLDSVSDISVTFLRGFRALRALRPLRMLSKNEGMKLVINSLLKAIPALFNVVLINLLFLLVFGILAVQLFQGTIGSCNDTTINLKVDCIGSYTNDEGNLVQREWIVPFNNYDNVLFSAITFFEISTLEGWPDTLFALIDGSGVDQGPEPNSRPWAASIFIIFIFITTFFVMNLFISVIVDKFNDEVKKKEGSNNFTPAQKEWVKMQRIMLHITLRIRPTPPKSKFRRFFYKIVQHNKFELFIQSMIGLNTLFLCMDYVDESAVYAKVLNIGNMVFVGIFTAEALCKLIAHGPKFYFLENWNKFDFIIVVLSLVAMDESIFSFKVTVLRIIRAARLLRMIKASKGLKKLLKALWLSLSSIANIGMILFLVFFSFSVAGMDLFGNITSGEFMNIDANFTTFFLSLMTLFRCSTGENWNGIMHDCYQGAGAIAILYWISFQLIAHYIFLNVFIAVIYENFEGVQESDHDVDVLTLTRKDIKNFVKSWSVFCPNGEHYMKTSNFPAFLTVLPPPLGYGGVPIEPGKLNKIIQCMNIRSHKLEEGGGGKVYFPEVMWVIFHSICGTNDRKVNKCEEVQNILKQLKYKYKGLGKNLTPDRLSGVKYYKKELTVSKYLCALQIYKNWKTAKERKLSNLNNPDKINIERSKQQTNIIVEELQPQKNGPDSQQIDQEPNNSPNNNDRNNLHFVRFHETSNVMTESYSFSREEEAKAKERNDSQINNNQDAMINENGEHRVEDSADDHNDNQSIVSEFQDIQEQNANMQKLDDTIVNDHKASFSQIKGIAIRHIANDCSGQALDTENHLYEEEKEYDVRDFNENFYQTKDNLFQHLKLD